MHESLLILHHGALGDTLCAWPVFLALDKAFAGREKYFSGSGNLSFLLRSMGFAPCPPHMACLERAFYEPELNQNHSEGATAKPQAGPDMGRKFQGNSQLERQTAVFRFCLDKAPNFIPRGATVFRSLPGDNAFTPGNKAIIHTSEALAAQAVAMGFDVPGMAEASARFQAVFGGWKAGESKKIALLPGAGHKMKQWPPQNFAALALEFARAGYEPLQILGPVEIERGPDLRTLVPALATATPKNLESLLAALLETALVIGNDSGPMHLAALAGVPTVTIFGPTPPEAWRPLGPRARHIAPSAPCAPCSLKADIFGCEKPRCLESATPDEVLRFIAKQKF